MSYFKNKNCILIFVIYINYKNKIIKAKINDSEIRYKIYLMKIQMVINIKLNKMVFVGKYYKSAKKIVKLKNGLY